MRRNIAVATVTLCGAGGALVGLAPLRAQSTVTPIPKDTILAASTNTGGHDEIWMLAAGKKPVIFAHVSPGDDPGNGEYPWICPIGVGPNGHLYVATNGAGDNGAGGTLWDATAGGDRTGDKPIATSIFKDQPGKMKGMAFDAAGNIYLDSSETGDEPVMKVSPDGKTITALKGTYNEPCGLAIKKDASGDEILYIVQAGDATVQTYNLTTNTPGTTAFATGFPQLDSHVPGSIVVDHQGHILLLWRLDPTDANNEVDSNSGALFDITKGGDFSDVTKTPPLVHTQFRMDVNQIAVDSQNNVYFAGNDSQTCWMSKYDSSTGKYATPVAFSGRHAGQPELGDSEAMAIAP